MLKHSPHLGVLACCDNNVLNLCSVTLLNLCAVTTMCSTFVLWLCSTCVLWQQYAQPVCCDFAQPVCCDYNVLNLWFLRISAFALWHCLYCWGVCPDTLFHTHAHPLPRHGSGDWISPKQNQQSFQTFITCSCQKPKHFRSSCFTPLLTVVFSSQTRGCCTAESASSWGPGPPNADSAECRGVMEATRLPAGPPCLRWRSNLVEGGACCSSSTALQVSLTLTNQPSTSQPRFNKPTFNKSASL